MTTLLFFSEEYSDVGLCFSSPSTQFYSDLNLKRSAKESGKGSELLTLPGQTFYFISPCYCFDVARPLFCPDSKEGLYVIIGYIT